MIIYKTTNLINGKFYVGQDSNNRPSYLGSGTALKYAIKKYGKENFKKEILEECSTLEQLNEREIFWIKELDAINSGYNIAAGGFKNGFTWSEEQKKRYSERIKNNPPNFSKEFIEQQTRDKRGENGSMWGKKHTEETKKKMSESHKKNPAMYWKGKKQPQEMIDKRVEKLRGSTWSEERRKDYEEKGNYFEGKTHTEESKEKIRQSRLGKPSWNKDKPMSEETKKKLSESKKGKKRPPMTEEHKEKIRQALLGKKKSKEHSANMSKGLKGKIPWNKKLNTEL